MFTREDAKVRAHGAAGADQTSKSIKDGRGKGAAAIIDDGDAAIGHALFHQRDHLRR